MSTYPHLARAPITEAVLDVRAQLPQETSVDTILDAFAGAVRGTHPDARSIERLTVVGLGGAASPSSQSQMIGKIFWSENKTRAVQARLDGFTVNHVGSYDTWETLRDQARSLWGHYVIHARPTKVVRCALRYINRIAVPANADMQSFLRTVPLVSDGLPQSLEQVLMRLVIPFGDGRKAIITMTGDDTRPHNGEPTLILDIDTFSEKNFDPSSNEFWEEFEQLRDIKNKCFFESLSPATWEAYQ